MITESRDLRQFKPSRQHDLIFRFVGLVGRIDQSTIPALTDSLAIAKQPRNRGAANPDGGPTQVDSGTGRPLRGTRLRAGLDHFREVALRQDRDATLLLSHEGKTLRVLERAVRH